MEYDEKTWADRLVEFPGRRRLTNVATGESAIFDVERAEGTVLKKGDSFSKENMDDLEQRISDGFVDINSKLSGMFMVKFFSTAYSLDPTYLHRQLFVNIGVTGWVPIAIAGFFTNSENAALTAVEIQSSTTCFVWIKSVNSNGASANFHLRILYVKTGFCV